MICQISVVIESSYLGFSSIHGMTNISFVLLSNSPITKYFDIIPPLIRHFINTDPFTTCGLFIDVSHKYQIEAILI